MDLASVATSVEEVRYGRCSRHSSLCGERRKWEERKSEFEEERPKRNRWTPLGRSADCFLCGFIDIDNNDLYSQTTAVGSLTSFTLATSAIFFPSTSKTTTSFVLCNATAKYFPFSCPSLAGLN